ncbi:DUF3473 domain-containing protein [Thermosipho africanus]|uniref:DUF3473 domain-containing protein n=1 Tax=Thermosipho africanus TaxID=2421 RepID=UPI0002FCA4B7|nr:DUF3473 domain-containing protein [Thermosipho africanus]
MSVGGGSYFRLYPFSVFVKLVKKYMKDSNDLVLYFQPWEFDPWQPRVKNGINPWYKFRHYVGLEKTYSKLDRFINFALQNNWKFSTLSDKVKKHYKE